MSIAAPDRASLLALEYRAGHTDTLEELYRELKPLLVPALARYRPGRKTLPLALSAEDLAQQSWIIVADLARRWQPAEGSFAAYTRSCFTWDLGHYVRDQSHARRSALVQNVSVDHQEAADRLDAQTGVDGRAWADELACRELLDALQPTERAVLLEHLVRGVPLSEVARRLGLTRDVAQRLLQQTLRIVQDWQRGEPVHIPLPPDLEMQDLVEVLHLSAREDGRVPGRARICADGEISQRSYVRFMARLIRAGCIVDRSQRSPGRLADATPRATLRRLAAYEAAKLGRF
jgi:RNA polymerase sigma factor (sigma-70 family)